VPGGPLGLQNRWTALRVVGGFDSRPPPLAASVGTRNSVARRPWPVEHRYVRITPIDPADKQVIGDLHDLDCVCYRVDRPHLPAPTMTQTDADWTLPHPGSALVRLQARAGDRLAGYAVASLGLTDNTASAWVDVVVHPGLRLRGIGSALALAIVEEISARGRKVAIGWTRKDGAGVQFARSLGAVPQRDQLRNMLYLDTLDASVVAALRADAQAKAADFALVRFAGPTPQEYLGAVAVLNEAMNDAPRESAALEDERWTAERVAKADVWRAARGARIYTVLALSADRSEPAAFTKIAVPPVADLALQQDTVVAARHRGHRLGCLLKVSMLDWLQAAEPQVRRISTFNAVGNQHMLAINEALGFVPVERWTFFELALPVSVVTRG
jgi:GNAT superfamily N-acetyltransferase/RimJ/RimL family protein N-acetyltransferase